MIQVRFLALLCAGVFADYAAAEPCSIVTPMANFDVGQNDGVWYVVEKYPLGSNLVETCLIRHFEDLRDGTIRLNTHFTDPEGERINTDGYAKFVKGEARFTEYYNGVDFEEKWILDTDYETYAVHFSCGAISPFSKNQAARREGYEEGSSSSFK